MTGSYVLDPSSTTIRCDCKAMFGTMTVHGTFRLISGQFAITPDLARCTVTARIAADTYDSGHSSRDRDVKSANLLDVGTYPEITFTGSGVQPEGDDWIVTGSVTAHGTTRPAQLRVGSASVNGNQVRFAANSTLDRTDFGITKMKGRVGRSVELSIDAAATRIP